jgi:hypothetical protein
MLNWSADALAEIDAHNRPTGLARS